MKSLLHRLINPLMAFIGIQLLWIVLVVFWVYWFLGSDRELRRLAERYSPDLLTGEANWFILVEGLLLLVAILAGVYVIFLYWTRQAALYRTQRDMVAQVTHELKSPLASLQLHLETIRRHRPGPERMEVFLDTMLSDIDRLRGLTDNLLAANRLERKGLKLVLRPTDLSELVSGFFRGHQYSLPRGGKMTLAVTPGLRAEVDPDALETVFRNLLENALLYAQGPPEIRISLAREGRWAHFVMADRGRGIAREEQKKIFRLFYRVRHSGETIRGTGLGLFIVWAMVRRHRGKTWVESEGPGKGAAFHIRLPLLTGGEVQQ